MGVGAARPARSGLDSAALALQVALDRAWVSPGVIDGHAGGQTQMALELFQRSRGLPATAKPDEATRGALRIDEQSATRDYTIAASDVAGPFATSIPEDLAAQGSLEALSYTSVVELLAERFHTEAAVLRRLNPQARFVEGETIQAPNVDPLVVPSESKRRDEPGKDAGRVGAVVVSRTPSVVLALDAAGALLFAGPVTSGSEHDPLPLGQWKVTDVYLLPIFHYNPALFWDAEPSHAQTTIKPGPNNPVGIAWIDIDREHYGFHGTPKPETVGRTASHGCVRLTNWDVARLLELVKPGTRVIFDEQPPELKTSL
jgi:peptidoglycan hydrolase-like protein with peptidoglycan-binding domain